MVGEKLEAFVGRVPYRWDDLAGFLDDEWCARTGTIGIG
jgi:hypothetical protein